MERLGKEMRETGRLRNVEEMKKKVKERKDDEWKGMKRNGKMRRGEGG